MTKTILNSDDVDNMIEYIDEIYDNNQISHEQKVWFIIMCYTGLRISEVRQMVRHLKKHGLLISKQ